MKITKVIISGGGTGGHIFPAIAIADEIKQRNPSVDILFVGAQGKMEMEKVPQAGYSIVGLSIVGFQRKLTLSNLLLPFKILKSLLSARKIIKNFNPDVVIGVGGYASGPTLKAATMLGIPTLIQEQNSFPGKTNKLLARKVTTICTAYEGLERFFPKDKIVLTGNPIRSKVVQIQDKRKEAFEFYQMDETKPTILVIGGSLGARTLNEAVINHIEKLKENNIQLLSQCGKLYSETLQKDFPDCQKDGIHLTDFITRMDLAYSLADVIISRAGAISISELCLVKKPVILVPSPNVAEDHQTHNAMALVNKLAALIVKDGDAKEHLFPTALKLLKDKKLQTELSLNIELLAKPNATKTIVDEIEKIVK